MISPQTFDKSCYRRVSYILPTKNREKDLEKTLANCRKFLTPEDELIVLDGVSTDRTKDVVEKYADIVDVFISEPDLNCTHALDKGILLSRGRYIKSLTDDDDVYPEETKQVIEIFEKHPEIDVLLCGGSTEKKGKLSYTYVPPGVNYGTSIEHFFQYPRSGGSQFFRKKALANIGLFPWNSTRPDGEMTYKAFYSGSCVRFCRINAFRHYADNHQGIIKNRSAQRSERNKFLYACAKESCSRSFYWKYVIINTLQESMFFRTIRRIRRILYRATKRFKKNNIGENRVSSVDKYIWDGGLS